MFRSKIVISLALLTIAGGVVLYTIKKIDKIPRFDENIEILGENIYFAKRYRYEYNESYSVNIQSIYISPFLSDVVEVSTHSGQTLNFRKDDRHLLIYFDEVLNRGDILDFWVRSKVDANFPYFNIVEYDENNYTLHYVSWESFPAIKTKRFIFPRNVSIQNIYSSVKNIQRDENVVTLSGAFKGFKKFDISISFILEDVNINSVQASPPVIDKTNVTFRVSKSVYDEAPMILGDFTGWQAVSMKEYGDFYIFKTNLSPGNYQYQIRYQYLVLSDDNIEKRSINKLDESYSIITIDELE